MNFAGTHHVSMVLNDEEFEALKKVRDNDCSSLSGAGRKILREYLGLGPIIPPVTELNAHNLEEVSEFPPVEEAF